MKTDSQRSIAPKGKLPCTKRQFKAGLNRWMVRENIEGEQCHGESMCPEAANIRTLPQGFSRERGE